MKQESKTKTTWHVILAIIIIGNFIILSVCNPLIGVAMLTFACPCLILGWFWSSKKFKSMSANEYFATIRYTKLYHVLLRMHEQILRINPNIAVTIGNIQGNSELSYYYIVNENKGEAIGLVNIQPSLIFERIKINTDARDFHIFDAFANRIKRYKNNGVCELWLPVKEPFDYGLVNDMVTFCVEQILL